MLASRRNRRTGVVCIWGCCGAATGAGYRGDRTLGARLRRARRHAEKAAWRSEIF